MEKILRINPDIIYYSPRKRTQQTAQEIKKIITTYRNKDIKLLVDERLANESIVNFYEEIKNQYPGKTILFVSHEPCIDLLWQTVYATPEKLHLKHLESIAIPTYTINNELDKWIFAALHETAQEVEKAMD